MACTKFFNFQHREINLPSSLSIHFDPRAKIWRRASSIEHASTPPSQGLHFLFANESQSCTSTVSSHKRILVSLLQYTRLTDLRHRRRREGASLKQRLSERDQMSTGIAYRLRQWFAHRFHYQAELAKSFGYTVRVRADDTGFKYDATSLQLS